MAQKRVATVAGLKTHYLQAGPEAGPSSSSHAPVIFMLHGQLPGSSAEVEFAPVIDRFAADGYTVYAPDLAGFGLTDNPTDFSIETRIQHVEAFIAFTGATPRALWGSSMGTYIGCSIALRDPRVEKLVITPSNVLPPPSAVPRSEAGEKIGQLIHAYTPSLDTARALLSRVLVDHPPSEALVQLFFEMSAGKNVESEQRRHKAGRPPPIHHLLKDLSASGLVLWGQGDLSATSDRGLMLFAGMPRAELHMLHRCGHWPQHDQTERVHRLVGDFLRDA